MSELSSNFNPKLICEKRINTWTSDGLKLLSEINSQGASIVELLGHFFSKTNLLKVKLWNKNDVHIWNAEQIKTQLTDQQIDHIDIKMQENELKIDNPQKQTPKINLPFFNSLSPVFRLEKKNLINQSDNNQRSSFISKKLEFESEALFQINDFTDENIEGIENAHSQNMTNRNSQKTIKNLNQCKHTNYSTSKILKISEYLKILNEEFKEKISQAVKKLTSLQNSFFVNISEKNDENKRLKDDLKKLNQRNMQLLQGIGINSEKDKIIQDLQKEIKSIRNENEELIDKNIDLEKDLATFLSEIGILKKVRKMFEGKINELEEKINLQKSDFVEISDEKMDRMYQQMKLPNELKVIDEKEEGESEFDNSFSNRHQPTFGKFSMTSQNDWARRIRFIKNVSFYIQKKKFVQKCEKMIQVCIEREDCSKIEPIINIDKKTNEIQNLFEKEKPARKVSLFSWEKIRKSIEIEKKPSEILKNDTILSDFRFNDLQSISPKDKKRKIKSQHRFDLPVFKTSFSIDVAQCTIDNLLKNDPKSEIIIEKEENNHKIENEDLKLKITYLEKRFLCLQKRVQSMVIQLHSKVERFCNFEAIQNKIQTVFFKQLEIVKIIKKKNFECKKMSMIKPDGGLNIKIEYKREKSELFNSSHKNELNSEKNKSATKLTSNRFSQKDAFYGFMCGSSQKRTQSNFRNNISYSSAKKQSANNTLKIQNSPLEIYEKLLSNQKNLSQIFYQKKQLFYDISKKTGKEENIKKMSKFASLKKIKGLVEKKDKPKEIIEEELHDANKNVNEESCEAPLTSLNNQAHEKYPFPLNSETQNVDLQKTYPENIQGYKNDDFHQFVHQNCGFNNLYSKNHLFCEKDLKNEFSIPGIEYVQTQSEKNDLSLNFLLNDPKRDDLEKRLKDLVVINLKNEEKMLNMKNSLECLVNEISKYKGKLNLLGSEQITENNFKEKMEILKLITELQMKVKIIEGDFCEKNATEREFGSCGQKRKDSRRSITGFSRDESNINLCPNGVVSKSFKFKKHN